MLLTIERLHKRFGDVEVLRDIHLEIRQGTTTIIIGPSGSGKSTLLNCMNLLELPSDGIIRLDEYSLDFSTPTKLSQRTILNFRQQTGMVFQGNHLFPHMTALENVMVGSLVVRKQNKADVLVRARMLLEKVGLGPYMDRYPHQLSGGQQQRVGIARAMSMEPKILLFDEPTSALDPELVDEVLEVMKDLTREGMTLVVVTHEMEFASRVADCVIFMNLGSIEVSGSPADIFSNTRNERLQYFVKRLSPGLLPNFLNL
ncbi:amino acid ABC transporter ATP-binding protein [Paenibacillus sp. Root444D2]|uniref:amino acid ABC transporter ATP-binding protein n=1 Tax=Paenibacillus sp. Root444D2 TaxID=1736538 RepID=UPI00070A3FD9|nr:amino acid ABC transporter ATP-binding protein [Paenibacillus sp. Root444D2]KQX48921.1 ectoine/hydroxyectoine ABC transporter ATP-binding protein EhuA [Paenibacillus sp. Root444D2]